MNLSVVIITKNEEENIERTLQAALKVSNDIVVVDSGSTDNTLSICKKYSVRTFEKKWEGYSAQKNFGNQQTLHDYILSVDADEVLTDEVASNIIQEMKSPRFDAYKISFRTNFCGQWIRFGDWKPEMHICLFNKKKIQWDNNVVHEQLAVDPSKVSVGSISGYIAHYSVRKLEDHVAKINHYTTLHAETLFQQGKKATFIKLYISPWFHFVKSYFFKLGFLDGFAGFSISLQSSNYYYLKYAKLKIKSKQCGKGTRY